MKPNASPIQPLTQKESEALQFLRRTLLHEGRTPPVRELAAAMGYKSPRSGQQLIDRLIEAGHLIRTGKRSLQLTSSPETTSLPDEGGTTVEIPLLGTAACGVPLLAVQNIETHLYISTELARPGFNYFLLRAVGDSMDRAGICEKDLVLVRQQDTAEDYDIVVALINEEATIKRFFRKDDFIVLKPCSSNPDHKPILMREDFKIQGKVVLTIPYGLVD